MKRTVFALPSGRFLLGAITAQDAAKQVFPNAPRSPNPGHNMDTFQHIVAAADAGLIGGSELAYSGPQYGCAGVSLVKPAIAKTVGGLALKFAPQAFAAGGPIAGAIVLAVAGISELFGAIFSHHAKAVAKERSVLCAAVPAANQSLELIYQMVASGQSSPADGMAALDSVLSGFRQAVAPIQHGADPTVSGECNAACELVSGLRAIVLKKKSEYQDLAAQQGQGLLPVISAGNLSSLLPWAAAGLALWLVLKEA